MFKRVLLVTFCSLLLGASAQAQVGSAFGSSVDSLRNTKRKLALTVEPPRTSNAALYYLADSSRQFRVLLKSKRFFRIGAAEGVELKSLLPSSSTAVEGAFKSKRFGTLRFAIEATDGKALTITAVAAGLARLSPELRTDALPQPIVASRVSRRVHLSDCNHLPDASVRDYFGSLEESSRQGYSVCVLCFPPKSYIGIPDYSTERELGRMARAEVFQMAPEAETHPERTRVEEAGRRVLARWPMPLRGYDYVFGIVRDAAPNAFACPTGMIYVTTGALAVIETESELEALLAHEIAHCERRHAYQAFRSRIDNQRGVAIAALLVGAAAASQDASPSTGSQLMDLVTNLGTVANEIAVVGHGRNNEEEADAYSMLYLAGAGLSDGSRGFDLFMSKMQYGETTEGNLPSRPDAFATHPDIEARIVRARETRVGLYPRGFTFDGLNSQGELVVRITLSAWSIAPAPTFGGTANTSGYAPGVSRTGRVYESRIFAMVDAYSDATERGFVRGMTLLEGGTRLWLDNYEDTKVRADATISMSFSSRSLTEKQLTAVEGLQLDMQGVATWVRRQGED
ncbi:MAG: M48 family metalloprotease [Candidatus Eisenbacteria bacterium]|uniref:M48 family metalloprotease n=1 Tax=Eiseniibacteriota bacterium TaxID=2212470 RepID=A0A933W2G5_UNCEI|nr:M48 family metalloprotease [Candidatus Eisenbacteria bacterium]